MNYRHAFHAGNFADVAKHIALVSILSRLKKKETPFAAIDSHAGRGLYDLAGDEALRTGEAGQGIERLKDLQGGPDALQLYLEIVRGCGTARYPGSPLIAAKLLRPQDRLAAVEKHPEDEAVLAATLAPFRKARAECADGYSRLIALLPPPERRGLVLIDPPYEAPDEFVTVARTIEAALRRFATGIFLVWFPIKSKSQAEAFCGEVLLAGPRKLLRLDFETGGPSERLTAAGLLVINPPFGFAQEMQAVFALIAPLLGNARSRIVWLAGAE